MIGSSLRLCSIREPGTGRRELGSQGSIFPLLEGRWQPACAIFSFLSFFLSSPFYGTEYTVPPFIGRRLASQWPGISTACRRPVPSVLRYPYSFVLNTSLESLSIYPFPSPNGDMICIIPL
jgi:hypothetical protein